MGALDTFKSIVNTAGSITNALTDASVKDFYTIRDFYNFIRKDLNCPMAHKNFFTVVPEIIVPGIASLDIGSFFKSAWKSITKAATGNLSEPTGFQFNEYNLARFALSIISISNLSTLKNTSTIDKINTPFGNYSYIKEQAGHLNSTDNSFTIQFMLMAKPIILDFIIPWLIYMQKNDIKNGDTSGKINLLIKFYRADEIAGMDFLMNPAFIYRITGVFPTSVTLVSPTHGAISNSIDGRQVTFYYNNLMVYSNADYEKFISGSRNGFQYTGLSPIQILNKLNSQASNVSTIYNKVKNIF